jgi:hypothetical protein
MCGIHRLTEKVPAVLGRAQLGLERRERGLGRAEEADAAEVRKAVPCSVLEAVGEVHFVREERGLRRRERDDRRLQRAKRPPRHGARRGRTVWASSRRTFIPDGSDTSRFMYVSTALTTSIVCGAQSWSRTRMCVQVSQVVVRVEEAPVLTACAADCT